MTATELSRADAFLPDAGLVDSLGRAALDAHARAGGRLPLLVVGRDLVQELVHDLRTALPGTPLHYAVKANAGRDVLRTVAATGVAAEVATETEAVAAVAAGWRPDQLWCTRLHLHPAERRALRALGVRAFVIEDDAAAAAATAWGHDVELLVRVDVGVVGTAAWPLAGRDGVRPDRAVDLAARWPQIRGAAFHVGSQQDDSSAWARAARAVLDGMGEVGLLDVGGGFPAAGLAGGPPRQRWADIGRGLAEAVPQRVGTIAEPGRALVADAGALVTTVLGVTERPGARWVHLDVGLYTGLPEASDDALAWRTWSPDADGEAVAWRVAGPSCDSTDVLARDRPWWLPIDLAPGDRLVLFGTGAYTSSYLPDGATGFNGLPVPRTLVI